MCAQNREIMKDISILVQFVLLDCTKITLLLNIIGFWICLDAYVLLSY